MRSVISTIACALAVSFPLIALAGPPLTDGDGDGVPDVSDNCSALANAHPANCDDDQDGYGNACDTDYNDDGVTDGVDAGVFVPAFTAAAGGETDANCDGVTDGVDAGTFVPAFSSAAGPGPSGLACAGVPPCP